MDPTVEPAMRAALAQMERGELQVLYTPSFKHLTRHPRKFLEVIEFAFSCGGVVVSPNYYLSNGYVARRTTIVRPLHGARDMLRQLRDAIAGAKGIHRQMLQAVMTSSAAG